jgi:hypothetical protein
MEKMAPTLGREMQSVLEARNIDRFHLRPLPFGKRCAGGAVNELVNLIQDFVILALFQPELGLPQVSLDNPDL